MSAKRLAIPKNLVYRELDDEIVLLDLDTSEYYSLNPTASAIWKYIEKGSTEETIAEKLSSEFKTDPETADGDVKNFVREVVKMGLVKYEKK